jgi:subtilase family serine protease
MFSETAWNQLSGDTSYGSEGGLSNFEPKPKYQTALTDYANRVIPDVVYNAENLVVDTYVSTPGLYFVGGTSAGAPQWAAIQAITKTSSNGNFYEIFNTPSHNTVLNFRI